MAPTHRSSSARSSQILLRQTPCPDLSARDGVDETPEARDRNLRTKDRVALAAARSSLSLDKEMEFDETKKWRMDRPVFSASMYPLYPDLRNPAGNGVRYIASQVEVSDAGALRTFADQWKQADYSDVLVLAPIVSGRGGGKPDMAMAGGSDANGIQDLLSAVAEQL